MTTTAFESTGLHFGEKLRKSKYGLKLSRSIYATPSRKPKMRLKPEYVSQAMIDIVRWMYRDDSLTEFSDAFLLRNRDEALTNFDLSMRYFDALDRDKFNASVASFLKGAKLLRPIDDLTKFDGVSGAYVMIFDEYKQYYVGKADDLRKRIKKHWSDRKHFDRLVFGSPFDSVFPVDEFRALDTTRIFVAPTPNGFGVEEHLVEESDPRFSLNRVRGGDIGPVGVLADALTRPRRDIVLESTPATFDFFSNRMDVVQASIQRASNGNEAALAQELASLPTTIYCSPDRKGEQFYWSYRYQLGGFLQEGVLPVSVYEQYLRLVSDDVLPLD